MKKNSKVSVALHALVHLIKMNRPVTSEELGSCQQTNPVIIRRILGEFKKAGIVDSEKGHGGGWIVLRDPSKISFLEIFDLLDESLLPSPLKLDPDEHCLIMNSMADVMDEFLEEALPLLRKGLSKVTIEDISKKITAEKIDEFISKNSLR
ncbi:MAG: transcriptional regulator [Halobacteriovoraceae bacterium]|nr:transcriptional regulator [Halobacteriovoraceae bacterium]|tara:strand:+ start:22292 stop:22744 length:453 start_codon:yes stop_codon:yes gene_type:complete